MHICNRRLLAGRGYICNCNDQRKKDKRTNNDLKNITQTTKDQAKRNPQKTGGELRCSKGVAAFPAPHVAPVMTICPG